MFVSGAAKAAVVACFSVLLDYNTRSKARTFDLMLFEPNLASTNRRTMTPCAKSVIAGCRSYGAMAEPTVGAGYARGLLELAVSKGASRRVLAERAGIELADLEDQ